MITSFRCLGIGVCGAVLLGCASGGSIDNPEKNQAYQRVAGQSLALNLALAVGLTDPEDGPLVDTPRDQLPPTLGVNAHGQLVDANMLGAAMSGPLATMISSGSLSLSGLDPLMLGLALLGGGELAHPATKQHVIAWMPRSVTDDKGAAKDKMKAMLIGAFEQAILDLYDWQVYTETVDTGGRLTGEKLETFRFFRGGPVCGIRYRCRVKSNTWSPIDADGSPAFVEGSGPVWLWRNWQPGDTTRDTVADAFLNLEDPQTGHWPDNAQDPGIDYRQVWLRATAHLPAWVYIYMPPKDDINFPSFFWRGQQLLFVS